jgi:hypothetical protein
VSGSTANLVDGSEPVSWVPAQACTLPTVEQPLRVAEFGAVFGTSLRGLQRPERGWLRLHLLGDVQVEALVRRLIARESECCSFFDFRLTAVGEGLQLDVRVPAARVEVLDGLARQAEAARAAGA